MVDRKRISGLIDEQLQGLEAHRKDLKERATAVQLDQSRVGRLSRMDAMQGQAMQLDTLRRVEGQMALLSGAANPAVLFCIACAEKKEQSQ